MRQFIFNKTIALFMEFPFLIRELANRFKKHWIESLAILFIGTAIGITLSRYAVGLTGWLDSFLYIHLALSRSTLAGRSIHIYLLMPFLQFFNTWITGANIFSIVIITCILMMTYIIARFLSKSILVGIIAVLILWAQPSWTTFIGEPMADFTITLFILLAIFFYLIAIKYERWRNISLIAVGVAVYFAFHSKEINATMLVGLILGLGFDSIQIFSWRRWFKDIGYIILGILLGVFVLMILDLGITGDALRSIRISSWLTHIRLASIPEDMQSRQNLPYLYTVVNRFAQLSAEWQSLTMLLLFIISVYYWNYYSKSQQIIWLIPLIQIMIWAATMSVASSGNALRHFFPTLPLISISAAQVFAPRYQKTIKDKLYLITSVLIALALAWLFNNHWYGFVSKLGWTQDKALDTIVYPVLLAGLLAIIMFFKEWKPITIILPLFCLILLLMPAGVKNWQYLEHQRMDHKESNLYPIEIFGKNISYIPPMNIYISKDLYQVYRYFHSGSSVTAYLLEVSLGLSPDQFNLTQDTLEKYSEDQNKYTYSFLTMDNWNALTPQLRQKMEKKYRIMTDPKNRIILIKRIDSLKNPTSP